MMARPRLLVVTTQRENRVKSCRDLRETQDPDPGRDQLDRQREAVKASGNVSESREIVRRHPELRDDVMGALGEKLDRLGKDDVVVCSGAVGERQSEWWNLVHGFVRQMQCLAACRQDVQPGARVQERTAEQTAGSDQVVAVVEEEEHLAARESKGEPLEKRSACLLPDLKHRCDRADDSCQVALGAPARVSQRG